MPLGIVRLIIPARLVELARWKRGEVIVMRGFDGPDYRSDKGSTPGRWSAAGRSSLRWKRRRTILGVTAGAVELARSVLEETRNIEVTYQRIGLADLPAGFDGYTLVQLSDIHYSAFVEAEYIARAVALANRLEPDLIVLTGDYVSHSRLYIGGCAELLGELRARDGVYAVLGNHDFWADAGTVQRAFQRRGIELLRNAHTELGKKSEALTLAGVDDATLGEDDLERALRGAASNRPVILLSHNPNIIWQAAAAGVALVLAGHTHGGQINIPSWRRRARRFWPYLRGYGQQARTQIYVNRGLGTVIVPFRYRCRPEITLIELRRE